MKRRFLLHRLPFYAVLLALLVVAGVGAIQGGEGVATLVTGITLGFMLVVFVADALVSFLGEGVR